MPPISRLNPVFEPEAPPVDFARLPAAQYRELFAAHCAEIAKIDGASGWSAQQVFKVDAKNGHRMFARLQLLADDGSAHVLLSSASCVELAEALLTYATAVENCNADNPAAIADAMLSMLEKFMHPCQYKRFSDAIALCAEKTFIDRVILKHVAERGEPAPSGTR